MKLTHELNEGDVIRTSVDSEDVEAIVQSIVKKTTGRLYLGLYLLTLSADGHVWKVRYHPDQRWELP